VIVHIKRFGTSDSDEATTSKDSYPVSIPEILNSRDCGMSAIGPLSPVYKLRASSSTSAPVSTRAALYRRGSGRAVRWDGEQLSQVRRRDEHLSWSDPILEGGSGKRESEAVLSG
jgi:hypothetical protein